MGWIGIVRNVLAIGYPVAFLLSLKCIYPSCLDSVKHPIYPTKVERKRLAINVVIWYNINMKTTLEKSKYRTTDTTTHCCQYHIVFCPRRRIKGLAPEIQERFKEIVLSLQEANNFIVLEMDIAPDRVHLVLDVAPANGVDFIVKRIKRQTANMLKKEFPEFASKIPSLWTREMFIATVGTVSNKTMNDYCDSQKGV